MFFMLSTFHKVEREGIIITLHQNYQNGEELIRKQNFLIIFFLQLNYQAIKSPSPSNIIHINASLWESFVIILINF